MKPNSGFVKAMLIMCCAVSVEHVNRGQINADHVRLMDKCLTNEAKEIILDLAEIADEKTETFSYPRTDMFVQSGLANLTEEEKILVSHIYGSQGREIEILETGITISPHRKVLQEKLRREKVA